MINPLNPCNPWSEKTQYDMTDKKQIHIAGKISSSQDGVVVYTDGCVPCHTAGHGNCPKVLLTYGDPIKF